MLTPYLNRQNSPRLILEGMNSDTNIAKKKNYVLEWYWWLRTADTVCFQTSDQRLVSVNDEQFLKLI